MVNDGYSRTWRLPAEYAARLSMQESSGLTGWEINDDIAYLHTDGSPLITFALAEHPIAEQARLVSSTAEIKFSALANHEVTFTVEDLREIEVVLGGLSPNYQYELTTNQDTSTITSDAHGNITLKLPARASVLLRKLSDELIAAAQTHPAVWQFGLLIVGLRTRRLVAVPNDSQLIEDLIRDGSNQKAAQRLRDISPEERAGNRITTAPWRFDFPD